MADRSPMMDQYRRIKAGHRDAVLFFRLGDFYEMFFEDAIEASALLDLTLTQRQGEPMCGIPYHAARSYIARLLRCGKKVAVCEQLTEPGAGKGLVERDVVEVVTPGTTVEEDFLEQGANNYLVAACGQSRRICLAYLDVSTGEFRAYSKPDSGGDEAAALLRSELFRLAPREILVQQSLLEREGVAQALEEAEGLVANKYPDWSFDASRSAEEIKARFRVASLKGFGFDDDAPELAAAGALLRYVDETARSAAPHLSPPLRYREDEYVAIDEGTRKNLEIVRNLADSGVAYSLLAVLNYTRTAPGARLLRQWLLQPLRDRAAAEARLDAVEFLYRDQRLLAVLREALGGLRDVERLSSRVAMDKAHAKDLLALRDSIRAMEAARTLLSGALASAPGAASLLAEGVGAGPGSGTGDGVARRASEAAALVDAAIREEPSILLTEGDLIRDGYDPELDRLRELKTGSRRVLEEYIEEERAASGISALRVRYNRIIGYYLEVSKGKLDAVPAHFIRRQSLVSGERFTTARLSELESEMNGATERIVDLERRLFLDVREKVKAAVPAILALGRAAAAQDCFASFAWAATARGYSRPRLVDEPVLRISEGRHPVVEAHLAAGAFVPNGLGLDAGPEKDAAAFALITGPNMAGKSTFLRQTALIALMAQAGSFVPALDAEIGVVDKIFCRVGAQDNLARGESTFLVEMHETAYILNAATERSLVVMDEVGRGTSTIDGLAIAWAVSERMLNVIRCRTLFATHYHELTAMRHARLRNLSLAVLEEGGEIVFLKQIREGPAESSYGIHVARLAGVPEGVLERARQVQEELARKESSLPEAVPSSAGSDAAGLAVVVAESRSPRRRAEPAPASQGGLFSPADLVAAEIASLDLDALTPLEALNRLSAMKGRLQSS